MNNSVKQFKQQLEFKKYLNINSIHQMYIALNNKLQSRKETNHSCNF